MANARTRYDTILDYMVRRHEAVAGQLYGKPAALLHGEAFMAYHFDGMAFRLQGRARLKASTLAGAKYWDPRSGDLPSMNWISVPTAHFLRWDGFAIDAMHQIKDGVGKRPVAAPVVGPPPAPPASLRWAENIQNLLAKIQSLQLAPQEARKDKPPSQFG